MKLHTKALYNLLRYNFLEDPSFHLEKWQIDDLRDLDIEDLFKKLNDLDVSLDKKRFIVYAEDCDTPESLAECLIVEELSSVKQDRIYLILFELWRRLLPERLSLSVFCDELDFRINLYDKDKLETDELIQDVVANLLDVLDENTDKGKDPKEVFASLSRYCAHDLESFLYDYIADQVDGDNDPYASDLIENFYQFLSNWPWFDFLRVRIISKSDIVIANDILKKIIDEEAENLDIDLSLEILKFMVQAGDPELFIKLSKISLKKITIEDELIEMLETIVEFFRRLDREDSAKTVQDIIDSRKNIEKHNPVEENDKDVKAVISIF